MISMETFVEVIGYVGTVLFVVSWQSNRRNTILLTQTLACAAFSVHLYIIQAYTGMAVIPVILIRNILFNRKETSGWANKNYWPWVFIFIFAIATALTWEGKESLLPFIGTIFGTYALWQDRPARMRLFALLTVPPWIVYYVIEGSTPGIAVCVLLTISMLVAIIRLDIRPKTSENPTTNN